MLFIEDTVPLRRLGSGFVRANDIVHAIDAAGYEVHVFPINGAPYDVMSLCGDLPERAEVLYDRDFAGLEAFLAERRGIYDLIWVARTHNLRRVREALGKAGREGAGDSGYRGAGELPRGRAGRAGRRDV